MDRWTEYDQGIKQRHVIQQHEQIHYTEFSQPDESLIYDYNAELQTNPRLNGKQLLGNIPKVLYDKAIKENPDLRSPDRDIRRSAWVRFFYLHPQAASQPRKAYKRTPGEGRRKIWAHIK